MTRREERRNIAKLTINTDGMYFMGLDVPYDDNIEVLLNGVTQFVSRDLNRIPFDDDSPFDYSSGSVIETITNSGMIENPLLFKRWVCAQTFRMLNYRNGDRKGWDAYMKDRLTYAYQFNMLIDEINRLEKMEREGGHDFEIESMFWTFNTVQQIYRENLVNVVKFLREQLNNRNYVVSIFLNRGRTTIDSIRSRRDIDTFIYPFSRRVDEMSEVKTYRELLQIMRDLSNMPICPRDYAKCNTWKSIYRGYGGFYTLYNLIGWHGITFKDMTMEESIKHLETLLKGELFSDPWKFHYILKEIIKENDFNLSESINRGIRMRIN